MILQNIINNINTVDFNNNKWKSPYCDNIVNQNNNDWIGSDIENFIINNNIKYEFHTELVNKISPKYNTTRDIIQIPKKDYFYNKESFYNSLFHEIIHSIGYRYNINEHDKRKEEIIAEIGSLLLCDKFNINYDLYNSLEYISWYVNLYLTCNLFINTYCDNRINIKDISNEDIIDLLRYCFDNANSRIKYLRFKYGSL